MQVLKVKNFGPIGENKKDSDSFFTVCVSPVTVFIGKTASGKSTVAKLCSIFLWLEKKVFQGLVSPHLPIDAFKNLCRQQEIGEYFSPKTVITYEGDALTFRCKGEGISIESKKAASYVLPKIQYVSAARNLLTILYAIDNSMLTLNDGNILTLSSNIPFMVNDLNTEYIRALNNLARNGFNLPIAETSVFYQNHCTFIGTGKKKISMSSASSGIQSITPLLVVSEFLSKEVKEALFEKLKRTNENIKDRIRHEFAQTGDFIEKFNLYCLGGKSILKNDTDIKMVEDAINRFLPSCFINIVEEPEQNLFPDAQLDVLYKLLEYKNSSPSNQLILSTHSPYILTALNNAIIAYDVFQKQVREKEKIISLIQENQMVPFEKVAAYKFEDGLILSIMDEKTRLIDASQIDECSIKINDTFDGLLELLDEQS